MKYDYIPKGVCSRKIAFSLDENNLISDLKFSGGCAGNLKALGILLEGKSAEYAIRLLKGNLCGNKKTSCADQLAHALELAINNK